MYVPMITMEKPEAKEAARFYRDLINDPRRRHTKTDEIALRAYEALARNVEALGLLSLEAAFQRAGADEQGYPKIAIARADQTRVIMTRSMGGALRFSIQNWQRPNELRGLVSGDGLTVRLPNGTLPRRETSLTEKQAIVPLIPPQHRPEGNLDRFHVLWEVDQWLDAPRPPHDPALLRYMGGDLWAVLAMWDLTEVERLALAVTR